MALLDLALAKSLPHERAAIEAYRAALQRRNDWPGAVQAAANAALHAASLEGAVVVGEVRYVVTKAP